MARSSASERPAPSRRVAADTEGSQDGPNERRQQGRNDNGKRHKAGCSPQPSIAALTLSVGGAFAGEIIWWTPNWGEAARPRARRRNSRRPIPTSRSISRSPSPTACRRASRRRSLRLAARPDRGAARLGAAYAQAGLVLPLDDVLEDKRGLRSGRARLRHLGRTSSGASPTASRRTAVIYNKGAVQGRRARPGKAAADLDRAGRRGEEADRAASKYRLRHHRRRRGRQHRVPLAALHLDERRLDHLART